MDEDKLKLYYSRMQSEFQLSHNKKDAVTNWSLTIVLATLGAYFGFSIEDKFEPIIKLVLAVGTFMILSQFFVSSLLAYGYLEKWLYLRAQIENYWINGNPSLERIAKLIQTYDHHGILNVDWKKRLQAQFMSGFGLILAIPSILIGIEIWYQEHTILQCIVITIFIGYIIFIIVTTVFYGKFRYVNPDTIE